MPAALLPFLTGASSGVPPQASIVMRIIVMKIIIIIIVTIMITVITTVMYAAALSRPQSGQAAGLA